jgi:outer membrane lipoprotein-sorting protein
MNKQSLLTWLVVFVLWMLGGFVVHGLVLQADYAGLPALFRRDADAQQYLPYMVLAHMIMAGAFVWIYDRGQEARPWLSQGLRYGVAVALLAVVPTYLIYYAVQPMPAQTVAKQIVCDTVLLLVLGAAVAYMRRGRKPA